MNVTLLVCDTETFSFKGYLREMFLQRVAARWPAIAFSFLLVIHNQMILSLYPSKILQRYVPKYT